MKNGFKNQKVFITGASRGIGLEIAKAFEQSGAVVIKPSREEMNLSEPSSVEKYIKEHENTDISVFVFCAGVNNCEMIEDITSENLRETYEVNLFSSIRIIRKYVESMKRNNYGKIIFISSLYATVSKAGRIVYSSSKHAITGVMKTLALELAPYNICVDAVAPGYVITEMTNKNLTKEEQEEICKRIPTGRFQEPKEIADTVLFLASKNNRSITGQTINIDGGFLCQ